MDCQIIAICFNFESPKNVCLVIVFVCFSKFYFMTLSSILRILLKTQLNFILFNFNFSFFFFCWVEFSMYWIIRKYWLLHKCSSNNYGYILHHFVFRTPLFPHLVPPTVMVWIFVWKYIFEPFIHILQHFVLQLSRSTNFCCIQALMQWLAGE
jgi:hypothetical protein